MRKRLLALRAWPLLALLALGACYYPYTYNCYFNIYGVYICTAYHYGFPYYSAFYIDVGSANSGYYATDAEREAESHLDMKRETAVPPAQLAAARDGAALVNDSLSQVFTVIEDLVSDDSSQSEGEHELLGPKRYGKARYRFLVKNHDATRFSWKLQVESNDEGSYADVMTASFQPDGDTPHGSGAVGVDLTTLAASDPRFKAHGQLFGVLDNDEQRRSLKYALVDLSPDLERAPALTTRVAAVSRASGENDVRLGAHAQVEGNEETARELAVLRARWKPSLGGRIDGAATGGDLAEGKVAHVSTCFSKQEDDASAYVSLCVSTTGDQPCESNSSRGDSVACQAFPKAATPASDPSTDAALEGAKKLPAVPSGLPVVDLP